MKKLLFHTDPDGEPHIHGHGLVESEVAEALGRPLEVIRGRDDSFIAIGRTRGGRTIKIIYADARDEDRIFVITAFDLPDKQLRALRRRLRRKRR